MGLSIAGFAFKPTALGVDEEEMIHRAFGSAFHAIQAPDLDSRLPGNLAVESRNGAVFVYRNKQTGQISNEASITARLLDLVMQTSFGICPWHEWNYKTEFSWYQVR